jgi:hypothetical protein
MLPHVSTKSAMICTLTSKQACRHLASNLGEREVESNPLDFTSEIAVFRYLIFRERYPLVTSEESSLAASFFFGISSLRHSDYICNNGGLVEKRLFYL